MDEYVLDFYYAAWETRGRRAKFRWRQRRHFTQCHLRNEMEPTITTVQNIDEDFARRLINLLFSIITKSINRHYVPMQHWTRYWVNGMVAVRLLLELSLK